MRSSRRRDRRGANGDLDEPDDAVEVRGRAEEMVPGGHAVLGATPLNDSTALASATFSLSAPYRPRHGVINRLARVFAQCFVPVFRS